MKIKPLVWRKYGNMLIAEGVDTQYTITTENDEWFYLEITDGYSVNFRTEDDAKKAAQEDHENILMHFLED